MTTETTKYTNASAASAEVDRRAERFMAEKGCGYREACTPFSRPILSWRKPTRNRLRE